MDTDDLEPPVRKVTVKKDFSRMSIGELQEHIAELKSEIARAEEFIAKKAAARKGADGFFKS
jgi:uncharacterized small protein (DUF1192 family)